MDEQSFGRFIRQRRREMDLTQEELARRVGCAAITIRKIEAEDARPSVQIAERLAMSLAILLDARAEFVRRARSIRPDVEEPLPTPPPSLEEIGSEDLTGRAIRGYALSEKIGSGGMGAVYRAVQPVVEREVAIKIILPVYANHADFIRRFETEAQLVARLEHPHIVPLYDYWREPGVAYLVMRLLRGGSLQRLIQEALLPVQTVARLMEQIGSALASAHRIGVIHRDLKPANILLDEDQNAYLADFGIAKNLGSPDLNDQTQAGAVIGSPQYMSPEQIRSLSVRPQSDIYCLGVMLYEMLTGKVPFAGPTPIDFIQQQLSAPMPSLSAHRTGLPASLDGVIACATAKNPDERYADVPSMLAEFRRAVSGIISPIVSVIEQEDVLAREIVNPYKGLRPFSEADADDFFGRETLVQQLLTRLSEGGDLSRFLAVIGPSGSGKSSVVKAGLIPALRRGGLLGSENWFYVDLLPGSNPFEELEAALLRVAVNPPSSLLSQLNENRGLIRSVNRILPNDPSVELVLVIDQFEELFTLLESEEERVLFLSNIVTAILDERSRVRVIITLRADFIDRPLRYVDFGELIQRRNELVLPLTPDELEQAILGPAKRVGLKVESGLVSAILRDLGDQPGTLPMLQYALTELFDQRDGNVLTIHGYQKIDGVLGALGRRAEEVFGALNDKDQFIARQIFLRLVTLGEGVEDTRRRVLLMELEQLQMSREASSSMSKVIESFSKSRLLTLDNDPITRGPTVEVAHEALLREWSRLRGWLDEGRADVRLQRQLANAAHEWRTAERDESFLLTGAHLEQFDGWSQTTAVAFTQDEREFLNASLEFAKREEARRAEQQAREATLKHRVQRVLQVLVAVLLIAAIVSGGLAYWANGQREEALRQASIGLASQAQLELDGTSPERSVLLALEALEKYPYTWQAERALGEIVHEFRLRHMLSAHTAIVSDVGWSPDEKYLASSSRDGTVRIWDTTSWTESLVIQTHAAFDPGFTDSQSGTGESGVRTVVWSPDGKQIVTLGNTDNNAIVWDIKTGEKITSFILHQDWVLSASWSPDSKSVVSSGKDGSIFIWDSTSGKVKVEFSRQSAPIQTVGWSPNGRQIVTAGDAGLIKLWDAKTGAELNVLTGHEGIVWNVSWSPNGTQLASAGEDGTIRIWDIAKGEEISDIRSSSAFWHVDWSHDGGQLATTNADGFAQVWNVSTLGEAFSLSGRTKGQFTIAWSPDSEWLATTSGTDSVVRVWDVSLEPVVFPAMHTEQAGWVMWSPDGHQLSTAADDFLSIIWDAKTGDPVHTLAGHTNWIQQAVWSPDGSKIATASFDNSVKLWDARNGKEISTFTGHSADPINRLFESQGVLNVIWSPDGARIASQGLTGWVRVWDVATGKELFTFQTNEDLSEPMSWSPDGSKIATCAVPQIIQIWDARTGKPIIGGFVNNTTNLTFEDFIPFCLTTAWSPGGEQIVTTSWDGSVMVWDAGTGEKRLSFTGHGQPTGAAWSPNDKRIATSDNSGIVKIWDAETGQELLSFKTMHPFLFTIDWSPDGSQLAGAGGLPSPSVWRIWQSTEDLITYTKECCVVRELTPEERQQFGLR
jgi:WD40 repeat protein/serine/threonine protein kinase/DNA-binding XRE family transcriptional regulator